MRKTSLNSRLIEPVPAKDFDADITDIGPILHLPTNPAGQMSIQVKMLQKLGIPASSCSYHTSTYKNPKDLLSPISKLSLPEQGVAMMNFAVKSAQKYNIFHFHAGQTFTKYNYKDLPYLSLLNKKMVMSYWGSELRRLSITKKNKMFERIKIDTITKENEIIERLNVISRYVDAVIVSDYELFEQLKGYFNKVYLVRIAVDHNHFSSHYSSHTTNRPIIVHAPSNQYIKGTDSVVKAIESLKTYANFDYIQIENIPHSEAIEWLKKADIVIDQLQLGTYATLSIESMLLGKPVVSYIREDLWNKYPKGLPIVSANPNTVEEVLHKLILNPELRYALGVRGRQYAVEHHSPEKIARQLITVYKDLHSHC
jgi:glycosyltransferase involved in cell wall biosynthesis